MQRKYTLPMICKICGHETEMEINDITLEIIQGNITDCKGCEKKKDS